MTTSVDTIVSDAARLLGDVTNVAWDAGTLVRWLNESQARIATDVVGSLTKRESYAFTASSAEQSLPADGIRFLGMPGLRAMTYDAMLREEPLWETSVTPSDAPTGFMPSPHNPKEFYVYPPHDTGASLEVEFSYVPADISLGDDITLADQFAPAMIDFIVYRALSEDTDLAEPGRAQHFLDQYEKHAEHLT